MSAITLGAKGKRVPGLQKGVNRVLDRREFDWRKTPVDGVAGEATFKSAHLALWLMGASSHQLRRVRNDGMITQHAFELLTGKKERSAAMKRRDEKRHDDARKLRRLHRESSEVRDGLAEWRGYQVPAWMVGRAVGPDGKKVNWLGRSVDEGWSGGLYSGFRDPVYSEGVCYQICGAPSCPGRCAGRSSEHSGKDGSPPGWGAIDVQDYENFGRIQRKIGSPLRNDLLADRPHYSTTGH